MPHGRFLLFLLLFATLREISQADFSTAPVGKKTPKPVLESSIPTARAVEQTVEVARGDKVTLQLRGISASGAGIEFRLLRRPQYGKLSHSVSTGTDTMEVVYRNSGDEEGNDDSLIYGVRAQGVGPFSPGEIKIKIIDPPAQLAGPDRLEFSNLEIGQRYTQFVVIANEGGEPASGTIEVSPQWTLDGYEHFRIGSHSHQKISVTFAPDSPGQLQGRLLLHGDSTLEIALSGTAVAPFSASPAKVVLQPGPDGKRVGVVVLQNNTDHPVKVHLESNLEAPTDIELKFGEAREVPIQAAGSDKVNTALQLTSGSYTITLPVEAPPAPAEVEIVSGLDIPLGEVPSRQAIPITIHLRNPGGVPATITVSTSALVETLQKTLTLESNGEAVISATLATPKSGDFRESLSLEHLGNKQTVDIHGSVNSGLAAGTPSNSVATPSTVASPSLGTSSAGVGQNLAKHPLIRPLSWNFRAEIAEQQRNSLLLRWKPLAGPTLWNYAVEYRLFVIQNKRLTPTWVPVDNLVIENVNGSFQTRISELEPATVWTFRIIASPASGDKDQPKQISAVLTGCTLPPFRLHFDWRWLLWIALVVMAGLVIRKRWRERATQW